MADAAAARDAFLAWHAARDEAAPRRRKPSWPAELESRVAGRADRPAAAKAIDAKRQQRSLATAAVLTDFRLYWEATVGVLAGRDKVLIDADKLPGRRHLLLVDPEARRCRRRCSGRPADATGNDSRDERTNRHPKENREPRK